MVRERKRTTTRGDHTNLIRAVRNKMPSRLAAREFSIPESTIRLRLKIENFDIL